MPLLAPYAALAFSLPILWPKAEAASVAAEDPIPSLISPGPALHAAVNADPTPLKNGTDLPVVGGGALLAENGPSGTAADINQAASSTQISIYVVREGDTLGSIAALFGVSKNTILWANDFKKASDITPGQTLVVLPVSGIEHTIAKGETLASLAKKYGAEVTDIVDFNNLSPDSALAVGDTIIIPDGIDGSAPAPQTQTPNKVSKGSKGKGSTASYGSAGEAGSYEHLIAGYGGALIPGYFARPLTGGIKTQGLHGYNGIDIGTPIGSSVLASADGTVVVAKGSGYNGGYGLMVAINHPNGTQTVYGHLSKVYVSMGSHVNQGDIIGLSGNSGRSTGPHLHFEVRGAANPF